MVDIRVHSLCCAVLWVSTNVMTCIYHHSIVGNNFTALKILCSPHSSPFPPCKPLATTDLFSWLHSFAFFRMCCSWNPTVASLFRLAFLFGNTCFASSPRIFCSLIAHFFFSYSLNNIPLYEGITVCLPMCLWKDIMVASNLGQLLTKPL